GQPKVQLRGESRGLRVLGQPLSPLPPGRGLGRQPDLPTAGDLLQRRGEILEQDAPGIAVHYQVVEGYEEQGRLCRRCEEESHPGERSSLEIEACLQRFQHFAAHRRDQLGGERREVDSREASLRTFLTCRELAPTTLFLSEAQAQGVMMLQEPRHCPFEKGRRGRWAQLPQRALI